MKGKRKVKTTKWRIAEQFKAEAQWFLGRRSARANRFLDVALSAGKEFEPTGWLAGARTQPQQALTTAGGQKKRH